jgi:hypothetical protein
LLPNIHFQIQQTEQAHTHLLQIAYKSVSVYRIVPEASVSDGLPAHSFPHHPQEQEY